MKFTFINIEIIPNRYRIEVSQYVSSALTMEINFTLKSYQSYHTIVPLDPLGSFSVIATKTNQPDHYEVRLALLKSD